MELLRVGLPAIIARTSLTFYMAKKYILNEATPDALRIVDRMSERMSSGDHLYIHNFGKELPYLLSGLSKYPPGDATVLKYCLIDSVYVYIMASCITAGILKIIGDNKQNGRILSAKRICYILVPFSPGLLYLTFSLRSEWGGLLSAALACAIVDYKPGQNRNRFQLFGLTAFSAGASLLYKPVSFVSVINIFIFVKAQLGNKDKVNIFALFNLLLVTNICLLIIYSEFIDEQIWNSGSYLKQYYGGIRDLVNVSGSHEVIKLYAKVPLSYILDIKPTIRIDEDFNRIANIARILMVVFIIWGYSRDFISRNSAKVVLLLYYAMTLPLIVYTGFYQSRYFIVYDTYLCVGSAVILSGLAKARKF